MFRQWLAIGLISPAFADTSAVVVEGVTAHPTASGVEDRYENLSPPAVSDENSHRAEVRYFFNSSVATAMKILSLETRLSYSDRQTPMTDISLKGNGETVSVNVGEKVILKPKTRYELTFAAWPFSEPGGVRIAPLIWMDKADRGVDPVIIRVCNSPVGPLAFLMDEMPMPAFLYSQPKVKFISRLTFCGSAVPQSERIRCKVDLRTYAEEMECTAGDLSMRVKFDQAKKQASVLCRNQFEKYFDHAVTDCKEKVDDRRKFY